MAAISVRGLDDSQLQALKAEARRQGISLNRLVLERITETQPGEKHLHADLDALAGTWSEGEAEAFEAAITPMEQVDADLWS